MRGLKAMGIGVGSTVLTIPNTFVASGGAIVAVGATPLLVDVGDDYQIDPVKATEIKADLVIPVHLTGLAKPYPHSTNTIHDAAQAVGAAYGGEDVSSFPKLTAFSLHPKIIIWMRAINHIRQKLRYIMVGYLGKDQARVCKGIFCIPAIPILFMP